MTDLVGLAVHRAGSPTDRCAVHLGDALVAETDAEHGYASICRSADDLARDPRVVGRAGTRRHDDAGGLERDRLLRSDGVVATYLDLGAERG